MAEAIGTEVTVPSPQFKMKESCGVRLARFHAVTTVETIVLHVALARDHRICPPLNKGVETRPLAKDAAAREINIKTPKTRMV